MLSPTLADLNIPMIAMNLLGGLAVFLLGMTMMADGLKAAAGEGMRQLLHKLTGNRVVAAISGVFITAATQSSSITTVLLVGFVSAGLIDAARSFGVIVGANVGSTFTAQIIAFNITAYAPILIAAGVFTQLIARRSRLKNYAGIVLGLGLIFAGMGLMSDATYPLRDEPAFVDLMKRMSNPFLAVLIGAAFTAVVQSSAATTGLVIVLAAQGFLTLEAGIAVALGANIGTCVTAIFAAIGKSRAAVRVAAMHVLFNVLGVLLWVFFIPQLADLTRMITPDRADLEGLERLAAEAPRAIANAHTLFNVINGVVFLLLATPMIRVVDWMLPMPAEEPDVPDVKPKFITSSALGTPPIAMDLARMEIGRAARRVGNMLAAVPDALDPKNSEGMKRLKQLGKEVDTLYGHVVPYLGKLSQREVSANAAERLEELLSISNRVRLIADIIETDFLALAGRRMANTSLAVSTDSRETFADLYATNSRALELVVDSLHTGDPEPAKQARELRPTLKSLRNRINQHLADILANGGSNDLATFRLDSDIKESMRRIEDLTQRIAKDLVSMEGGTPASEG
ncbi:Na/Pi cotransporter family protein [Algisphaera agarilytica]|uniref:Phosphate:Na+ symporter n=1 Tax=Algisphaera agarilytica TaxID=1385975 RepID=A0A7X0H9C2_9BACT|nr:Na/Pi cotransporter family protein [Algisphaera agarilytica]MBB6430506.1 phosphate:Na+ symporter [Algisphaera agarilytica]